MFNKIEFQIFFCENKIIKKKRNYLDSIPILPSKHENPRVDIRSIRKDSS